MLTPVSTTSHLLALVVFIVSALASAGCVLFLRKPAVRWGLVDKPGGRKQHELETPVVGGIAMAAAFLVAMIWFSPMRHGEVYLLIGLVMLVALGVIDDLRDLSARKKLIWQVLAALVIVVPQSTYIYHLGDILGTGRLELGVLALPFTVFAIVGLINAVNMSDGIDGSAGGMVVISLFGLSVVATQIGRPVLALELIVLFGVTAGFLWFNMRTPLRSRAVVFMGDAGSMMLGAGLAWFAVHITQFPPRSGLLPPPIVILWILGLPILDTIVLMCRRVRQGRSPFSAGRDHMHHIWTHAGFSIAQTTGILMVVQAGLGAGAVAAWRLGVPEPALFVGYLVLVALHRSLANHAWKVSKWLRVQRIAH